MTKHSEDITQKEKDAIRTVINSEYGYEKVASDFADKRIQELNEEIASIRKSSLSRVLKLALIDGVEKTQLRLERERQEQLHSLSKELTESASNTTENKRGD